MYNKGLKIIKIIADLVRNKVLSNSSVYEWLRDFTKWARFA